METIQIILEILIFIIGFYLAFFKSYFQEKGKNIATKEDIQEITGMVETIKSQLHFNTQSKISLKAEERNALVNYYEKYNFWLNTILNVYFSNIVENNQDKLNDFEIRMNEAKFNYDLSDGRMELFVDNKDLTAISADIKIKTLEFQHIVESYIKKMETYFIDVARMRLETPIDLQLDKFKELLVVKGTIITDFNKEKIEKYKEVSKIDRKFQIIVYNHLQRIISEE